ncbi:hypothetical protein [Nannocystis pusilla]|uniref:hypothetical protein n=1 Tax=Nannocystis pusilla TaxID=889268 RepID=UPI003B80BA93
MEIAVEADEPAASPPTSEAELDEAAQAEHDATAAETIAAAAAEEEPLSESGAYEGHYGEEPYGEGEAAESDGEAEQGYADAGDEELAEVDAEEVDELEDGEPDPNEDTVQMMMPAELPVPESVRAAQAQGTGASGQALGGMSSGAGASGAVPSSMRVGTGPSGPAPAAGKPAAQTVVGPAPTRPSSLGTPPVFGSRPTPMQGQPAVAPPPGLVSRPTPVHGQPAAAPPPGLVSRPTPMQGQPAATPPPGLGSKPGAASSGAGASGPVPASGQAPLGGLPSRPATPAHGQPAVSPGTGASGPVPMSRPATPAHGQPAVSPGPGASGPVPTRPFAPPGGTLPTRPATTSDTNVGKPSEAPRWSSPTPARPPAGSARPCRPRRDVRAPARRRPPRASRTLPRRRPRPRQRSGEGRERDWCERARESERSCRAGEVGDGDDRRGERAFEGGEQRPGEARERDGWHERAAGRCGRNDGDESTDERAGEGREQYDRARSERAGEGRGRSDESPDERAGEGGDEPCDTRRERAGEGRDHARTERTGRGCEQERGVAVREHDGGLEAVGAGWRIGQVPRDSSGEARDGREQTRWRVFRSGPCDEQPRRGERRQAGRRAGGWPVFRARCEAHGSTCAPGSGWRSEHVRRGRSEARRAGSDAPAQETPVPAAAEPTPAPKPFEPLGAGGLSIRGRRASRACSTSRGRAAWAACCRARSPILATRSRELLRPGAVAGPSSPSRRAGCAVDLPRLRGASLAICPKGHARGASPGTLKHLFERPSWATREQEDARRERTHVSKTIRQARLRRLPAPEAAASAPLAPRSAVRLSLGPGHPAID